MSERLDLVEQLLDQSRVPALSPGYAARVVAEAQRADRVRATPPPLRRWRRTRRTAWTTIVAVNLLVASAVAAAFGGGGRFVPETVVAATHRLVERLSPHLLVLRHPAAPQRHAVHRPPPADVIRTRPAPQPSFIARPLRPRPFRLHDGRAPMRLAPLHVRPDHRHQIRGRGARAGHWHRRGHVVRGWRANGGGARWHHPRGIRPNLDRPYWQDRPGRAGSRAGRADGWRARPMWRGPRPGRPWRGPGGRGAGRRRF